ncbi:MAG TPA: response regulator transcription factor [Ktedonobacteraceae bacterium]|nr:response regulator transcription factor [Ktedonobacteraceae bacterium]
MPTILVVEDEVGINNLIRSHLEADGHQVHQAYDGLSALTAVAEHHPQLVILDWMLPGLDGLAACRYLRQQYLMPIIMLTARSEEVDRILGLEVGADDYISKPFSIRELMARVRAMLRRVALDSRSDISSVQVAPALVVGGREAIPSAPAPIIQGPLMIAVAERQVMLSGAILDLTPKEYELLVLLASHPGRAFSREFLLQQLWGYDYDGFDRTVDTHVMRLRKKLGVLGEKVLTVWGVGYRFVP